MYSHPSCSKIYGDGHEESEELCEKRKRTGLQMFLHECERPRKRLKPRRRTQEPSSTSHNSQKDPADNDDNVDDSNDEHEVRQSQVRSHSEEV